MPEVTVMRGDPGFALRQSDSEPVLQTALLRASPAFCSHDGLFMYIAPPSVTCLTVKGTTTVFWEHRQEH